jgi:hypothetical protein
VTAKCCVCLVDSAVHALVPCGHVCLCSACRPAADNKPCPMCRGPVERIVKLHYI